MMVVDISEPAEFVSVMKTVILFALGAFTEDDELEVALQGQKHFP